MFPRGVYNKVKRYTNDYIVLLMIKNWLISMSIININLFSFNIRLKRKFDVKIRIRENDKRVKTTITLYASIFVFKKKFEISDIQMKKKSHPMKFQQKIIKYKSPIVNIDKKQEELDDVVINFYKWKQKTISKYLREGGSNDLCIRRESS